MPEKNVYPYIITLRNDSGRYVNVIGFLLSFGSALLFIREMIIRNVVVIPLFAGTLFIVGLMLWSWYQHAKNARPVYFSKALLIAGLVWTKMPYFPWLIAVFALLAILEYQAKLAPEIGFSSDHIVFNGLFKKRIQWAQVDNVVLKDGMLTIDLKNNRLIQREIDSGENEASEEEFNTWVKDFLIAESV